MFMLLLSGIIFPNKNLGQVYDYSVDLISIKSDRVQVNLKCPEINTDRVKFCFPAIIPGHHFWVNYGRFIEEFKAYDSNNNVLEVHKEGLNDFIIPGGKDLHRISYSVNDTHDSDFEEKVMGWSETNFIEGELFVINPGGVFGFFEGMESLPVKVSYKKPEILYGSSALRSFNTKKDLQEFIAKDYHQLVDCPVIFSIPDTTSIKIANCVITISCYNEAGVNVSGYIAELIKPRMEAVAEFAGGILPVNNYVFLYYLDDYSEESDLFYNEPITFEKIQKRILQKHGTPVLGALEHSNSSFHNLVYIGKNKLTDELLVSSAVHEFLHIYTPLNLRSNIRADFNYSEPVMSKHIWLYEGVTEYFSDLLMLKSELLTLSDYLNYELRLKILTGNQFPDGMRFTEMSERIFEVPFKSQFYQVYNRGAVIAMLLDFEIMKLTDGKQDLRSIFFSLINKYGIDKPFDENNLFFEISEMVHPDLTGFFEKYINGTCTLDLKNSFMTMGINLIESHEVMVPESILTKGFGVDDVIEFFGAYTINNTTDDSPFLPGDKIISSDFGYNCLKPFIDNKGEFISEGESAIIPVYRDKKWTDIKLTPTFRKQTYRYQFKIMDNPNDREQVLLSKWLSN